MHWKNGTAGSIVDACGKITHRDNAIAHEFIMKPCLKVGCKSSIHHFISHCFIKINKSNV